MGLRAKVEVPENLAEEVIESEVEMSSAEMSAAIDSAEPVQETPPAAETKQVAVKEQSSVPTIAGPNVVPSLQSLRDKWDTAEVGGVFKRIVGTNGALYIEKVPLGEFADIQVYSHNSRTMVVPISANPNDPNIKKWCRASYDHKTIFDRESGDNITIEAYAESISDKFPGGVKVGRYHDLFCSVFSCQKNLSDAKALGIVQVSISPTAVKDWTAFEKTTKFRELQGTMLATHRNCVRLVADPRSKDSQNYVAIVFQPVPLDVLAGYTPILEE